jgi:hypothetical protein
MKARFELSDDVRQMTLFTQGTIVPCTVIRDIPIIELSEEQQAFLTFRVDETDTVPLAIFPINGVWAERLPESVEDWTQFLTEDMQQVEQLHQGAVAGLQQHHVTGTTRSARRVQRPIRAVISSIYCNIP